VSVARLRVVQWATGNIGRRALRELIRSPELELAGVLVHDTAKVGVDAGVLCGEEPVGVLATDDRSAIRDLEADCVSYMPRAFDLDDVVSLLERGTNIVTIRGELFGGGRRLGAERRAQVLDACARGEASIYATGSSPGFITEVLPFALLALQRRVESIEIEEFADLSRRDSPHMLFEQMGFGQPIGAFDARRASYLLGEFRPSLEVLLAAAGRAVDDWAVAGEVAAARHTTALAAGVLAAGTVAAQRTAIVGRHDGAEIIRFTTNWYCTTDVDPAWDLRSTGWRLRMRGDAPLDVDLVFPVPLDDLASFTPAYTADPAVNAIPYVCAAAPGIVETADLPPLTPGGRIIPRTGRARGASIHDGSEDGPVRRA
jgi:4-hydroxy-tetrahydrodipicolinate reductase